MMMNHLGKKTTTMKYNSLLILAAAWFLALQPLAAQGVQAGPWVCDTDENSLTILWTSEVPGMAYVELEDGTVHYEMFAGRRIFQRLHSIRLDGFKPGSVVKYRVCGQNLLDDSNPYNPVFGKSYTGEWNSIRTLDTKASSCRFSVFNDIHLRTAEYASLAAQVDSANTDFLFLNGDIVTAGNYLVDSLVYYSIEPLGDLPHGLPVFFARGNHEGRGNNPKLIADIYPRADSEPFYYTFRQGPVAFLVLDAGETGEGRSVLYCGTEVYEDYIAEQMEWAQKAMREPWFRKAPLKVCILHVPMIDHQNKDDYNIQRYLNRNVLPMLNKAGFDFMIGADLHEFMCCDTGTMGNDFPILVNEDARRLEFSYTKGGTIDIKTFNADGTKEFERSFRVR